MTSALLPKRLLGENFSSKPLTDESQLVRDQEWRMVYSLPTKSCNIVLHCCHSGRSRIVIQQQNARSEELKPLFLNRLFSFDEDITIPRMHCETLVPTPEKSTQKYMLFPYAKP
ncbi:hypothetical protein TNCV_1029251 [Trichonephila clavipes]|nr:hypothetical protein TNCV_1029251 [Trichonephila clavipes]